MVLLYRAVNSGTYAVIEVATRDEARRYEPFQAMPSLADASTMSNHLNGHSEWPKKDCIVCRPDQRPAVKEEKLSNGELTSRAIAAAEARLRERMDK